ncbi:MAG TPA: hypothetical protein VHM89_14540 [Acidimicrobiales bacterium]|nr:hypothetical protein [Acidimicrobiales bacterium]
MTKRAVAAALVAVFAVTAVAAVVAAIAGRGGDDGDVAAKGSTTAPAALTDTGRELVDRLASARRRTLHLAYRGTLPGAQQAGTMAVELWWKGDRVRQTIAVEAADVHQESASYVLPSGNLLCQKSDGTEWACQRAASGATAKPTALLDALVAQLAGKKVTTSKVRVGDTEADCYTVDAVAGNMLCLRADDVPVKVTVSGAELVVTTVSTEVDDGDFTPPAEPSEAPIRPTTPTSGG